MAEGGDEIDLVADIGAMKFSRQAGSCEMILILLNSQNKYWDTLNDLLRIY